MTEALRYHDAVMLEIPDFACVSTSQMRQLFSANVPPKKGRKNGAHVEGLHSKDAIRERERRLHKGQQLLQLRGVPDVDIRVSEVSNDLWWEPRYLQSRRLRTFADVF